MKKLLTLLSVIALSASLSAMAGSRGVPAVYKNGQLTVDGKPFTLLAGELHNSTTGSVPYMRDVWKQMADKNLNTVIAAASWELVEPEEGKFNFREVDAMIDGARDAGLRLVVLWFGSWKNGDSSYTPSWVKLDQKRFPRAHFQDGQPTQALSPLGKESQKADARAFAALLAHIRDYDQAGTVIMVQVENELGSVDVLSTFTGTPNRGMRDYSPAADKAFKGAVPKALITYLKKHKGALHPAVEAAWKRSGYRTSGSWEEVFGTGTLTLKEGSWQDTYPYLTEELFNTWQYALYVEAVASAGKKEYPLPMYVNAWQKTEGQCVPGNYPCGGPLPHVSDIWKAAAPSIDFLSPDIYATNVYDWICDGYTQAGYPLFIPETTSSPDGASRAFYTFGKYGAACYAPFGIDSAKGFSYDITYALLGRYLDEIQGGKTAGLLIDPPAGRTMDQAELGGYRFILIPNNTELFTALTGASADAEEAALTPVSGVLILQRSAEEFLILGGVGPATLSVTSTSGKNAAVLSVDEIRQDTDGSEYLHRLNGDETSMGITSFAPGQVKALRVRLYQY